MATIHQVVSAQNGQEFISIGPALVHHQMAPRTSKNQRIYSRVILKSASSELSLMLWDEAAKWKLPLAEVELRGKFVRDDFSGKASLKCEDLTPPDGAVEFEASEVQGEVGKPILPKMQDCLDAGVRCADYVLRKDRPELTAAAFAFGCNALLQGVRLE